MILTKELTYDFLEYVDRKELLDKYIYVFSKNDKMIQRIYDVSKKYLFELFSKYQNHKKYDFLEDKFFLNKWINETNYIYKLFLNDIKDEQIIDYFLKKNNDQYSYFYSNFFSKLIGIYNLDFHIYLENRLKNIKKYNKSIKFELKKTLLFNHIKSIKYQKYEILEYLIHKDNNYVSKKNIKLIIKLLKDLMSETAFHDEKKIIYCYFYTFDYANKIINIIKKYQKNMKTEVLDKIIEDNIGKKFMVNIIQKGVYHKSIIEVYEKIIQKPDDFKQLDNELIKNIDNKILYFLFEIIGLNKLKELDDKIFTIDNKLIIELIIDYNELKFNFDDRIKLLNYLLLEKKLSINDEDYKKKTISITYGKSKNEVDLFLKKITDVLNNNKFCDFLLKNCSSIMKKINFKYENIYLYYDDYNNFYNIIKDFYSKNTDFDKEFKINNFYDFLFLYSIHNNNQEVFYLFKKYDIDNDKINYKLLLKNNLLFDKMSEENIKFIVNNNILLDSYLMEFAALTNNLYLIKTLKNYNCPYDVFVLFASCKNENFEIFKWCIENNIEFDIRCYDLLKKNLQKYFDYTNKDKIYINNYNIDKIRKSHFNNKLILNYIIQNNIDKSQEGINTCKNLLNEFNKFEFKRETTFDTISNKFYFF